MTGPQTKTVVPYGAWPSPLSSASVAEGSVRLAGLRVRDGLVYWSEQRPDEQGRSVIVRTDKTLEPVDILPPPYSARSAVHEYGGGAWWLGESHTYFTNWADQRLYRVGSDGAVIAITPEPPASRSWRYGDGIECSGGQWVICVRERHEADATVFNELVAIAVMPALGAEPATPVVLIPGGPDDFVAAPRLSPDSRQLSWLRWSHPNMPWDGTELWVAELTPTMELAKPIKVAGGSQEAIHGPDWRSDGKLVFSTDRSGWWNLHVWDPQTQVETALTRLEGSEIGQPMWVFDTIRWGDIGGGRLMAAVTSDATDSLALINTDGSVIPLETDLVEVAELAAGNGTIVVNGSTSNSGASIAEYRSDGEVVAVARRAETPDVDPAWFSHVQSIRVERTTTTQGASANSIHALLHLPSAPGIEGPHDSKPPLIVISHGGPTAHASPALNLKIQYWTSRGFAVADVNYGGSSGFGRDYRRLLREAWGVIDVADCVAVASELVNRAMVDPDRVAIRGSSSGGLTVLGALASSSVFSAGTSLYGVTDLEALARDTHKFESRYLDSLIGPYPAAKAVYKERSPITHTGDLDCPVLVLQGLEDEIVPPSQAEAITDSLRAKGIAHAYVTFPGEQHGFRQKANVSRSLDVELWFYGRVFGFDPADPIEPPDGSVGL